MKFNEEDFLEEDDLYSKNNSKSYWDDDSDGEFEKEEQIFREKALLRKIDKAIRNDDFELVEKYIRSFIAFSAEDLSSYFVNLALINDANESLLSVLYAYGYDENEFKDCLKSLLFEDENIYRNHCKQNYRCLRMAMKITDFSWNDFDEFGKSIFCSYLRIHDDERNPEKFCKAIFGYGFSNVEKDLDLLIMNEISHMKNPIHYVVGKKDDDKKFKNLLIRLIKDNHYNTFISAIPNMMAEGMQHFVSLMKQLNVDIQSEAVQSSILRGLSNKTTFLDSGTNLYYDTVKLYVEHNILNVKEKPSNEVALCVIKEFIKHVEDRVKAFKEGKFLNYQKFNKDVLGMLKFLENSGCDLSEVKKYLADKVDLREESIFSDSDKALFLKLDMLVNTKSSNTRKMKI